MLQLFWVNDGRRQVELPEMRDLVADLWIEVNEAVALHLIDGSLNGRVGFGLKEKYCGKQVLRIYRIFIDEGGIEYWLCLFQSIDVGLLMVAVSQFVDGESLVSERPLQYVPSRFSFSQLRGELECRARQSTRPRFDSVVDVENAT